MTKIKLNDAVAGHGSPDRSGEAYFSFAKDQIVEIEDDLAAAWVSSGLASRVPKDKPKVETAVAKKPETPEAPKVVEVPKVESKAEVKTEVKEDK